MLVSTPTGGSHLFFGLIRGKAWSILRSEGIGWRQFTQVASRCGRLPEQLHIMNKTKNVANYRCHKKKQNTAEYHPR
jgi:hypothetical protein